MNVIELFPSGSCMDIVAKLRELADQIEQEGPDDDLTVTCVCVTELESGNLELFGWGRNADRLRTLGLLTEASRTL